MSCKNKVVFKKDPFVNSEGDHVYYDRALIEKKEFQRRHPEVKDVRTLLKRE